ncbi:MAG: translation initiation factor IF-2 [Patescibacteria group bacterium]|nr:translation initiation factor IF-2 [Patescibacteria group bacterium]
MNVSDLARRLKVTPQELLDKLPELGFDIGARAIKIDNIMAEKIFRKWIEKARRDRLRGQLLSTSQQTKDKLAAESGAKKEVLLPEIIIVRELAGKMNLPVTRVIQELMRAGILASQNERLDFETAAIIADELGFEAKREAAGAESHESVQAQDRLKEILDSQTVEKTASRPPVVVVMGHVDHGKTRTLDAIRKTNVMEGEAGGITQHIGAYQVQRKGRMMTFIDTPGHEAFTVMRSRGAKVADIAILVVAADDGVQPQTKEVIDIIHAAHLPFIVALNKIDKPEADPDRVLAQLAEYGVTTEAWGGTVPMVKISAKQGVGIDDLLEMILLIADMNADQIKADPNRLAAGTIIESHVDKAEGPVSTILVQTGTLHRNDWLGMGGNLYGRVRAMRDWNGKLLDAAGPGVPVKVLGFKVAPAVGDIVEVPEDFHKLERKAKTSQQIANQFTAIKAPKAEGKEGEQKKIMLNIVVKADVLGSLEAILGMLEKIDHEYVGVEVLKKGLGNITESDIESAAGATPSVVYGFNTVATPAAAAMAREKKVEVKQVKIIYELIDDVVARLNKLLPPEVIRTPLGSGEVVAVFRTEKDRMVVGCKIRQGMAQSGAKLIVWRKESGGEEQPVGEGVVESLQVGKEKVKEVHSGQECGISYRGKEKLQTGDRLEIFSEETKIRKVEIQR